MEYGARPSIGAANHDDGDARPIETGEIGDTSDAEFGRERHDLGKRILRGSTSVSADPIRLQTRSDVAKSVHLHPAIELPNSLFLGLSERGVDRQQPTERYIS